MTVLQYDGSYAGLLTAIFEVYEYQLYDASIGQEGESYSLFGNRRVVHTDMTKAERVLKKLEDRLSKNAIDQFYSCYLSGLPAIENSMLGYVRYVLASVKPVENDYSHRDVLTLQQTGRKVQREKHRMEAFVRFQLTKDGLYYSMIQPDFNVLPLISKHFEQRYADQRWLIYDVRRKYGLYYDEKQVSEVQLSFEKGAHDESQLISIHDENEELYQRMWQQYFSSVNSTARKNLSLHVRLMPRRYWRYLTEKKPRVSPRL
jgi:probable DNA metabolism protein